MWHGGIRATRLRLADRATSVRAPQYFPQSCSVSDPMVLRMSTVQPYKHRHQSFEIPGSTLRPSCESAIHIQIYPHHECARLPDGHSSRLLPTVHIDPWH